MKGRMKMANIKSYEEFEKEFKETEPELTVIEQVSKDRILKILNQRVGEVNVYGDRAVKKELALMDLHMEEIQIIERLSALNQINGEATNVVYQKYKRECLNGGLNPMNQIGFSRFIVKYFDYTIYDKKIKGKKYRIFIDTTNTVETKKTKKLVEEWWK